MFLTRFVFPSEDFEWDYRLRMKLTCYESLYPFFVLSGAGLREIFFKPITILYGGNGSGKSTALNVMADKLHLSRLSAYNRTHFFSDYVDACRCTLEEAPPPQSRIITSDDVFDMMLDIRAMNDGITREKESLLDEYRALRENRDRFQLRSLDDYETLRKINLARSKTASRFTASLTAKEIRERSNGENALDVFRDRLANDGLYLLDEPENSLSPKNQMLLAKDLAESARYCGCQLVISTHSPFLLAIPGSKIIDLDHGGEIAEKWTDLENARVYYDFFKTHAGAFED